MICHVILFTDSTLGYQLFVCVYVFVCVRVCVPDIIPYIMEPNVPTEIIMPVIFDPIWTTDKIINHTDFFGKYKITESSVWEV